MEKSLNTLEDTIRGTWWLLSREDYTNDGQRRVDPVLGADPVAILVYAKEHFAAQFMKKDRDSAIIIQPANAGKNNTASIGGYDAYFGTYQVSKETSQVAHTLIGSISPGNIGMTVYRNLRVEDDKLIIKLETTSQEGEPVIRTLTWKRIT